MHRSMYGTNIALPSLDNLFSSEEERQDAKLEKVQNIPVSELYPFEGHPFQVRDDEEMDKMVDSIKQYGVMTPAIARPRPEGGYELISGHRRHHGAMRAGMETLPCIIREMDDDTAIILMVDSNCQREHILPSEKAKAYQMKIEAIKRQGARSDLTSRQLGEKLLSVGKVADGTADSERQVHRYIRLNELIPELQEMVDANKLKFNPAVEISYLTPEEQEAFYEYVDSNSCTPSLSQAQRLKKASKEGSLTDKKMELIMCAQPPSVAPREQQLVISYSKVEKYFPQGWTSEQMTHQILKLLESFHRNRHRDSR
ncbi:MAG: ParB/RepB/Spo0J family partition protein [Oscillospiraceae bacterium]|nr:ParB/RepB/Spo0J family partition protein [Oscillospiraceae bacterium]